MTVPLPVLYHWSPSERRELIREEGLRPYRAARDREEKLRPPYVCLDTSPSSGWNLSGALEDEEPEIEIWDLWQVRLSDDDKIRIRADLGACIREIKVYTPIPPDRVWFVGTREVECMR